MLSNVPQIAFAEVAEKVVEKMITTTEVVESLSRSEIEKRVRTHLSDQDVQNEFSKLGLSSEEISSRMASLSTSELNRLADQMDQARYGGNVVGILVVVILVLLIIYLAKRV